jgi:hypothetical protein
MTGDPITYRLPPGIGVIEHGGRIVVYEIERGELIWARPLGEAMMELTPDLRAAVDADRSRAAR